MRVKALALHREHRIDDVLERARTGQAAVLGDMADEQHRDAAALGHLGELQRPLAHLQYAARRGRKFGEIARLNGIDEEDLDGTRSALIDRHAFPDGFEHALEIAFREHGEMLARTQPRRAQLQLPGRLLARDIQHAPSLLHQARGHLQKERGLADAGIAADQRDRSGNDAAPEHAIEFGDAGFDALGPLRGHIAETAHARFESGIAGSARPAARLGRGTESRGSPEVLLPAPSPARARTGNDTGKTIGRERVPLAALGALPVPLREVVAAVAAKVSGFPFLALVHFDAPGRGGPKPMLPGSSDDAVLSYLSNRAAAGQPLSRESRIGPGLRVRAGMSAFLAERGSSGRQ